MIELQLFTKISSLPDHLKKEVEDFVDFLISRYNLTAAEKKERVLGLGKGTIIIKDNFDDPIEGFEEYT